jgi:hypothetical protein
VGAALYVQQGDLSAPAAAVARVQAFSSSLKRGQAVVYPRGWPHYQLNPDCKQTVTLALGFNAADVGTYNLGPLLKAVPTACEWGVARAWRPCGCMAWPAGQAGLARMPGT